MAEERAETDAGGEVEAAAAKGTGRGTGRGTLLLAGGGVLVLAGVAAGVWKFGLIPSGAPVQTEKPAVKAEAPYVGALLPIDPFIANLGDEDGKRYLKTSFQVEFYTAKVPEEFIARMPQLRDLLLTLLTSKLFAEIRTPEGKALLRDEIINRVNRALNKDLVKAVYFTEFIVQ